MKIKTLQEARKSLAAAQTDLNRCKWARNLRDKYKVRDIERDQDLLKFYLSQWPKFSTDPNQWQRWSDQLGATIAGIEKYLIEVDTWMQHKIGSPKSVLPKKKQRQLGLLPPI